MPEHCLVCEGCIFTPYAHACGYPICSEACAKEWNELTSEEKERYIECRQYIHSEAYC